MTYDHSYTVTVTREALDASPSWWAEQDNPPLSARRALQLATEKATQVVGERPGRLWKLESVELIPAGNFKWFWLFRYVADTGCCTGIPCSLTLAVLMDGRVVPLQIDPKGEKQGSMRWERLSIVARRVEGRALGCLIREGMTREQVDRLLAVNPGDGFGISGVSCWGFADYDYYGVTVYFVEEGKDERVSTVSFAPLFGE
jgi:hypothetical protein